MSARHTSRRTLRGRRPLLLAASAAAAALAVGGAFAAQAVAGSDAHPTPPCCKKEVPVNSSPNRLPAETGVDMAPPCCKKMGPLNPSPNRLPGNKTSLVTE